jgi:hypothetical protein
MWMRNRPNSTLMKTSPGRSSTQKIHNLKYFTKKTELSPNQTSLAFQHKVSIDSPKQKNDGRSAATNFSLVLGNSEGSPTDMLKLISCQAMYTPPLNAKRKANNKKVI